LLLFVFLPMLKWREAHFQEGSIFPWRLIIMLFVNFLGLVVFYSDGPRKWLYKKPLDNDGSVKFTQIHE
jgi:hypothetical protein